jgi:hypothetical protein
MGIKLLILVACTIAGESVASHADVGDTVEVSKDDAASLTRMDRARYLEKADDPTKGLLTASAEDKTNVRKRAAAIKEDLEQRAIAAQAQSPAGLAALVAASVATAVQAALGKPGA